MKNSLMIVVMLINSYVVIAQNFPSGFDYQAVLRNEFGNPVVNTDLDSRIGLYTGASNEILVWEEIQLTSTNSDGYYQLLIGDGTPTDQGLVNDFDAINWSGGDYSIKIEIDHGQGYEDFGLNQLYSVPFAYYAKQAENQLYLNNMVDVDTNGLNNGDVLRWNGMDWQVFPYSDTVMWANNALNALHANYSDTAAFAYGALACPPCDTSFFSFYGDSALWSLYADTVDYSLFSVYSDTALIAMEAINTWKLTGNVGNDTSFFGTLDSNDIRIVTNGQERMRIKANGKIGIGDTNPQFDLQIKGNNGVFFSGDFGSETTMQPDTGSATFWLPGKSAFRTGYVNSDAWNLNNIGNYSFAGGFNSKASGDYSFAFGEDDIASGEGSIAMGYNSRATGKYAIAMGAQPLASGYASIALGRYCTSSDSMAIAMGYWSSAAGNSSIAMGKYAKSNADYSVAIGERARTLHEGAIVLSDGSSTSYTVSTGVNQFVVRAAGGTIIYSNAAMDTGVSLLAGSGSWSTLSDSTLKENITLPDVDHIIQKAKDLEVYSWNYIAQNDSIRHIGPMAQDFYAAFGLGESERTISAVDFDGINLLLLKSLIDKEEELSDKLSKIEELSLKLNQISFNYDQLIVKLNALIND